MEIVVVNEFLVRWPGIATLLLKKNAARKSGRELHHERRWGKRIIAAFVHAGARGKALGIAGVDHAGGAQKMRVLFLILLLANVALAGIALWAPSGPSSPPRIELNPEKIKLLVEANVSSATKPTGSQATPDTQTTQRQ